MRAIDTNVLVRFLVADDPDQASRARAAIEAGDIFVPTTVLLESEWVLRSAYRLHRDRIARALGAVAGLPGVSVEAPVRLAEALEWLEAGMDFADALHLLGSAECDIFLSFDRALAKAAGARSQITVEEP